MKSDTKGKQKWKQFRLTTADGDTNPFALFSTVSMAIAASSVNEVSFLGWRPEHSKHDTGSGRSQDRYDVVIVGTFRLAPSLEGLVPTTFHGVRVPDEPIPFALANEIPATIQSLENIYYCQLHYVNGEPLVLELSGGVWQRTKKRVHYSGGFKGHPKGPLWWSGLLPIPAPIRRDSEVVESTASMLRELQVQTKS